MIKLQKNLLYRASIALLIPAMACSDDNLKYDGDSTPTSGEKTVTFVISPQTEEGGTRAMGSDFASQVISRAGMIDVIKFAVYEKDADGTLKLAPEFRKESTPVGQVAAAEGQNVIDMSNKTWPIQVQLVVDPAKSYRVAFWAQNSEFSGYNTDDLEEIKVAYAESAGSSGTVYGSVNNNEASDAFCAWVDISGLSNQSTEVILTRPFAQINVGTAGWDYEGAAALVAQRVIYTESNFTVSGVAQYYNLLGGSDGRGVALTDDAHPLVDVIFAYSRIPSFAKLPADTEILQYTPFDDEEYLVVKRYGNNAIDFTMGGYTKFQQGLEFYDYRNWAYYKSFKEKTDIFKDYAINYLYKETEVNDEGEEEEVWKTGQKTSTDLYNEGKRPLTEVYKYLSMCYVLVPESSASSSSVVNVKFQAKGPQIDLKTTEEKVDNPDGTQTTVKKEEITKLNNTLYSVEYPVLNVPVKKNWRTNILGSELFVYNQEFILDIVPGFEGYFNLEDDGESSYDRNHYISFVCTHCKTLSDKEDDWYIYNPWEGIKNPKFDSSKPESATNPEYLAKPGTEFGDLYEDFVCPKHDGKVPLGGGVYENCDASYFDVYKVYVIDSKPDNNYNPPFGRK